MYKLKVDDVTLVRSEERMIARIARDIERAIKASFVTGYKEGVKDQTRREALR